MRTGALRPIIVHVAAVAWLVTASARQPQAAQAGQSQTGSPQKKVQVVPARTAWGDPLLEGVYTNDDETGIPMERPAEFQGRRIEEITPGELEAVNSRRTDQFNQQVAGNEFAGGLRPPTHLIFDSFQRKNSRPWLIVDPADGRMPPRTAEARERLARQPFGPGGVSSNINPVGPFNSHEDLGLYDRCVTRGLPGSMMPAGYGSYYEIIQSQHAVAIRYEMVHEARVIALGRRSHVGQSVQLDLGDPVGWWDGDTLVVETTNFTARSAAMGATDHLTMTERFTPIAPTVVEWRVTFDDPHTWTRPWSFAMNLTRKTGGQRIYEYACHEGNYGLLNILTGARAADRR